jgi:hypothetical protein
VNARLAAALTAVHAPAWRRRYGDEFCALLEELPANPYVLVSAGGSALATRVPVLATIGAFALAAAVLLLGPAASDRRAPTAQMHAPRPAVHPWGRTGQVACGSTAVAVASDGTARC